MGYVYSQNGSLICVVCGKPHAIKRRCPFDWCSPTPICKECWKNPEVKKTMSADKHKHCYDASVKYKQIHDKEKELWKQGKWVRWSARGGKNNEHGLNIAVRFKNAEFVEDGTCRTFLMSNETYNAFDLSYPATIEEFQNIGKVVEVDNSVF